MTALPAHAATITVNDTSSGSFFAAIQSANADPGADVIDLRSLSGTITLDQHLPSIVAPVTILGPGSGTLTLDFDGHYALNATGDAGTLPNFGFTVTGLTLTNALDDAIAVEDVHLTLDDIVVEDSVGGDNLWVSNGAAFTTTITNFTSTGASDDGLDLNVHGGTATLSNLTVTDNGDHGLDLEADGGSITVSGENYAANNIDPNVEVSAEGDAVVVVSGFVIEGGDDEGFYVNAYTGSTVEVRDSTASGTHHEPFDFRAEGSGSRVTGTNLVALDAEDTGFELTAFDGGLVEITRSIASGNERGFTVDGEGGTITLDEVLAEGNELQGLYSEGYVYDDYADLTGSSVLVQRSLFTGNQQGGIDVDYMINSEFTIENVTVTGNTSECVGGIEIFGDENSISEILHSTIVDNSAGGCPQVGIGGNVRIAHSIIAGSEWDLAYGTDGDFVFEWNIIESGDVEVTAGYLLESANAVTAAADFSTALADPTNLLGVDPELGSLVDNGGFTATLLPAADSPAIDGGDPSITSAPETDQRGEQRVSGAAIDLGAVEIAQEDELAATGAAADAALAGAVLLLLLGGGLLAVRTARRRTA